ncbi:hypothetical protein [Nocardia sp. NBC_01327]|uniref:hypothetical protein n=1 Tax=Nocardia sp. NBC_01327 TaxID=2903593 RepID=UPI002E152942|nr:hypothetical protein OG326_24170 [Nocardia sp. NBC_01327]
MADPTPLEAAIVAACEFAAMHGADTAIRPGQFGIRTDDCGLTTATYVDADHAVIAYIDHHGHVQCGVAEIDWVHLEPDEDREICDYCEVIDTDDFRPVETRYLPGDAPVSENAHA